MRKFGSPSSRSIGPKSSSLCLYPMLATAQSTEPKCNAPTSTSLSWQSFGRASFCGNPQISRPPRDRSLVVEIHRMNENAAPAPEANRNHLAALGEIAKAGRIRQADKFEFD
jgi:hypothetical protein